MNDLVLLDEELALLAPDVAPLPWLDAQGEALWPGALTSTARSLLLRGLAVQTAQGLCPARDVEGLLSPLGGERSLRLVVAVQGRVHPLLTVLRPADQGVLVQDVSPDGVHRLSAVPVADAEELLRACVDPLEGAAGQAVVRVLLSQANGPDHEVLLVAEGGRLLRAGVEPGEIDQQLDPPAVDRLAGELLAGLLAATPRAACG